MAGRLCEPQDCRLARGSLWQPSGKHTAPRVALRTSCIKVFSSPAADQNAGKIISKAGVHPDPWSIYISVAGSRALEAACFSGNPGFPVSRWIRGLVVTSNAGALLQFKRDRGSALGTDGLINSSFRRFLGRKYLLGFSRLVRTKPRTAACFQTSTKYPAG